jgi:hypothetical protein
MTTTVGELAGVVQQIADDLSQSDRVRIQVHGHGWQREGQFLVLALQDRAHGVHDVVHDGRQVDPLGAKLDLASTDATGVEQVIDQPDHLADLPLQYI